MLRRLFDKEIDALGILLVPVTIGVGLALVDALGNVPILEDALGLVMLDELGAENLGQFAAGIAPKYIHLP